MSRRHAGSVCLCAALALTLLSGCSAIGSAVDSAKSAVGLGPKPVSPDWNSVVISATDNANGNSAVAVDLVLVKDQAMLESLQTMPAAKWFATRADLQRTFPEALTVYPYELVPNQSVKLGEKLYGKERAWGAFVFANYGGAGEHRARLLLNAEGYVVQLGEQGFAATALKTGSAR